MKANPVHDTPRELLELWDKVNEDYLVFMRDGKPVAYLLSAERYDEEDIGYMTDPAFWKMIRERQRSNEGIPLEQIEAEIAAREQAEARGGTKRVSKNGRAARNGKAVKKKGK